MPTPGWNDFDFLLPATRKVLTRLADATWVERFTFVGGSALALYLHHRLSEDIDLFTWEEQLDQTEIIQGLEQMFPNLIFLEQTGPKQIDVRIDGVQVTFFANNWDALQNRIPLHQNLSIADLDLLAGMKLNTLFLRSKFRDYYDLYTLHKEQYTISRMYEIIAGLMPGMNERLFQMALIYTDDIIDDKIEHLQPKYHISKVAIGKYFEKHILEWMRRNG
ncbi:MAG: nucleotidyl transferase AbiEii/AbiGii toxin family protein [Lewinellaceae bacterium]|nr:nucleotidyl transferase AbiEii/AbiGii toxin family protein [Lewinellaceae bacterium]